MAELPVTAPPARWVERSKAAKGLDLLGLRAAVQRVGYDLFAGVTTITPMIRYLGLRAWILHRFGGSGLSDDWGALRGFADRIEAAVAIGNLLVDRGRAGIVGKDNAAAIIDSGREPCVLLRLVQQGILGIYTGPSDQLEISYARGGYRVPGLSSERGVPLARAVEELLGETAFGKALAADPELKAASRRDLEEVGRRFAVGAPPPEEAAILTGILIPEQPRPADKMRVGTYGMLLRLARGMGRAPKPQDLWAWSLSPKGERRDKYAPWLDRWAAYLMRDMLAVVHEYALEAVRRLLPGEEDGGGARRITEAVADILARPEEIIEPIRAAGLWPASVKRLDASLARLRDGIVKMQVERRREGVWRWEGPDELRVIDACGPGPHALGLLPVAWILAAERVAELDEEDGPLRILSEFGEWRLGLSQVVIPGVASMLGRGISVEQACYELAERTVRQHLRVAWARLGARPGHDVSVVWAEGDSLWRRGEFVPGRTESRLDQAIGWLGQLGLVVDGRGLTATGAEALARAEHGIGRG